MPPLSGSELIGLSLNVSPVLSAREQYVGKTSTKFDPCLVCNCVRITIVRIMADDMDAHVAEAIPSCRAAIAVVNAR